MTVIIARQLNFDEEPLNSRVHSGHARKTRTGGRWEYGEHVRRPFRSPLLEPENLPKKPPGR